MKLATNILPRLNEVSGADGEPLQVDISEVVAKKRKIK